MASCIDRTAARHADRWPDYHGLDFNLKQTGRRRIGAVSIPAERPENPDSSP